MKKIFSSFIILCLFLFLAWGVTGWFIGSNAETALKKYLTELEEIPGEQLFRAELLDYKKTLLGAKARIKISSDTAFLNERLGDFELDAHFFNGPVFISFKNEALLSDDIKNITTVFNLIKLNTGTSRWKIVIDESSVEDDKAEYLHSLFPNGLPIGIVRTDFDNKAYYQSRIDLKYAAASLSGIYNLDNGDNQGSLLFDRIEYGVSPRLITAERATLHYQHQRSITSAYKPGTTQLEIEGLEINHEVFKGRQPLKLDLTVDTAIQSELNDVLNGLVKINLEKTDDNIIPIRHSDISIKFDNIPASGFIELSEQQAIQDNLRQQIQWALEEKGEFPEGQDHLWQLNDQLNTIQQQLPEKIARLFLKSNNSQVIITATTQGGTANQELMQSIQSTLKGKISLKYNPNKNTKIDDLLVGEGQVSLSNDLFNYLNPILNRMLRSKEKPTARDFKVVYREGEFSVATNN